MVEARYYMLGPCAPDEVVVGWSRNMNRACMRALCKSLAMMTDDDYLLAFFLLYITLRERSLHQKQTQSFLLL